jgi:hypothetical protein
MDYKLTLISIDAPNCTIGIEYEDGTSEQTVVGNLPLKGTAPQFVTAAKTYITNLINARATEKARLDALKPSPAVEALIGQSTVITI